MDDENGMDMDEDERRTMETYRAQLEVQLAQLNERLQQAAKKRRVKHEAGAMALPVEPPPAPTTPAVKTQRPAAESVAPASRPKPSSKRQASPAPSVASVASTAKPSILPSSKPRPVAAPLRSTQPVPKDLGPPLHEADETEDDGSMSEGGDSYGCSGKYGNNSAHITVCVTFMSQIIYSGSLGERD